LAKLTKRNLPIPLVRTGSVTYMLSGMELSGTPYHVYCKVLQGGVLPPLLFATYVDDLIMNSGYRLHMGSVFMGSILYADDTALLACSCFGL